MIATLDAIVRDLVDLPRQHYATHGTKAEMPRLLWNAGVSTITDITAAQKMGILFTITIISFTAKGEAFFAEALEGYESPPNTTTNEPDEDENDDPELVFVSGTTRLKNMRKCFQLLLCYWMWLKRDTYWKRGDRQAKQAAKAAIQALLDTLITCWPRTTGQGWKLAKIHEQLHVPDDIERNGSPKGSHSGPTEHNHIALVKKPGQRTQRQRLLFDKQLARRVSESYIIDTCISRMEAVPPSSANYQDGMRRAFKSVGGAKGVLCIDEDNVGTIEHNHHCLAPDALLLLMEEFVGPIQIPFFTEYRRNGELFRAHPLYHKRPWHDWIMIWWELPEGGLPSSVEAVAQKCNVHFGDTMENPKLYGYSPGKILAFIEYPKGNYQAVVETCSYKCQRPANSKFLTTWEPAFVWKRQPGKSRPRKVRHVCLVDVDSIVRHCLIIPYDDNHTSYLEVWARDLWGDQFHVCSDYQS